MKILKINGNMMKHNGYLLNNEYYTLSITTDEHSHVEQSVYYVNAGTKVPFNPTIDEYYRADEYQCVGCSVVDGYITVTQDCSVTVTTHENVITLTTGTTTKFTIFDESTYSYDSSSELWINTGRAYLSGHSDLINAYPDYFVSVTTLNGEKLKQFWPKGCKNVHITGGFHAISVESYDYSSYEKKYLTINFVTPSGTTGTTKSYYDYTLFNTGTNSWKIYTYHLNYMKISAQTFDITIPTCPTTYITDGLTIKTDFTSKYYHLSNGDYYNWISQRELAGAPYEKAYWSATFTAP